MKHATPAALARLGAVLDRLRAVPGLIEKRPGVFYRKGRAFLHFHEDPKGLFADYRPQEDWLRLPVGTAAEQEALAAAVSGAAVYRRDTI